MEDGVELKSLLEIPPHFSFNLALEIELAISMISALRGNPCICYIGNTLNGGINSSIIPDDEKLFIEMVGRIKQDAKEVDFVLVTNGGQIDMVPRLVNVLRPRFDTVNFLLPGNCMSAGTIWALSGDTIWMGPNAYLGPIDPQLPEKDGRFGPAQSLLVLLDYIREESENNIRDGKAIPWDLIRLVDTMNQDKLGTAINLTRHSSGLAADFLFNYKFKRWDTHSKTGEPVTEEDKRQRAYEIARLLAQNSHWKSHGHSINRARAETELNLKIEHFERQAGLDRMMRKIVALSLRFFDIAPVDKVICAEGYNVILNRK